MTPDEQKELDKLAAQEGEKLIQQLRKDKGEKLLDAQGKPLMAGPMAGAAGGVPEVENPNRRRNELLAIQREHKQKELLKELQDLLAAEDTFSGWFLAYGVGQHLQAYAEMALASNGKLPLDKLQMFIGLYSKASSMVSVSPVNLASGLVKVSKMMEGEIEHCRGMVESLRAIREANPGLANVEYGAVTPKTVPFPSATFVVGEEKDRTDFMMELKQVYEAASVKTAFFSMGNSGSEGVIPRQWWDKQGKNKKSLFEVIDPIIKAGRHVLLVPSWELFFPDPAQQGCIMSLLEKGIIIYMGIPSVDIEMLNHCITVGRDADGKVVSEYSRKTGQV